MSILVQEAGFEPANRYGLGPHPSAFDQAGRLLQYASLIKRIYQHIRGRVSGYFRLEFHSRSAPFINRGRAITMLQQIA